MANFHVGQKVVCVYDTQAGYADHPDYVGLKKGQTYTITKIDTSKRWWGNQDPGDFAVWVDGARATWKGVDWPLWNGRFRPVAEKPTAMDVIRSIVLDPSKPIPADPREPVITPVPEYEQGAML